MKIKLVALVLSGVMLSSIAFADTDLDPTFYVGGELHANKFTGTKKITAIGGGTIQRKDGKSLFKKSATSGSVLVGSRLNNYAGVEAGYSFMSGPKFRTDNILNGGIITTLPGKFKTKNHNVHFDVLGFVPVADQIDLIGSLGAGRLSTKITQNLQSAGVNQTRVEKSSKAGLRAGMGVGYKFDDNLSARLMVRHQKGNKLVKNFTQAGLGLLYNF